MNVNNTVKNYNFVVLGPTGAGKSSLINLFFLLANETQFESLETLKELPIQTKFYAGDGSVENLLNGKESSTQKSKFYSFPMKGTNSKLNFMDTPGFGDTRGIIQDDINALDICDQILGFESVSAILLVFNGSEARLSSRLEYVLQKIKGILSKHLISNVFILFTHVNTKPNVSIEIFDSWSIPKERIFNLNNQIFLLSPGETKENKQLSKSYTNCTETLKAILERTESCSPSPTASLKEVTLDKRKLREERDAFHTLRIKNEILTNWLVDIPYDPLWEAWRKSVLQIVREKIDTSNLISLKQIQSIATKIKRICPYFDLGRELEKTIPILDEEVAILMTLQSTERYFDESEILHAKDWKKSMCFLFDNLIKIRHDVQPLTRKAELGKSFERFAKLQDTILSLQGNLRVIEIDEIGKSLKRLLKQIQEEKEKLEEEKKREEEMKRQFALLKKQQEEETRKQAKREEYERREEEARKEEARKEEQRNREECERRRREEMLYQMGAFGPSQQIVIVRSPYGGYMSYGGYTQDQNNSGSERIEFGNLLFLTKASRFEDKKGNGIYYSEANHNTHSFGKIQNFEHSLSNKDKNAIECNLNLDGIKVTITYKIVLPNVIRAEALFENQGTEERTSDFYIMLDPWIADSRTSIAARNTRSLESVTNELLFRDKTWTRLMSIIEGLKKSYDLEKTPPPVLFSPWVENLKKRE